MDDTSSKLRSGLKWIKILQSSSVKYNDNNKNKSISIIPNGALMNDIYMGK